MEAAIHNADRLDDLREVAASVSPRELLEGIDVLGAAVSAVEGNGAPRLQLEAAFLTIAGTVRG